MELILSIFTHPDLALRQIRDDQTLKKFSRLALASAWLSILISLLLTFQIRPSAVSFILFLLVGYLALVLLIDFKTMWIHFVSENMGGEGKVMTLFSMLVYSFMPFHLVLPFSLFFQPMSAGFSILMWLYFILWTSILGIKSIRINYNLSLRKIWIVILTPLILFFTAMVMLSLMVASFYRS